MPGTVAPCHGHAIVSGPRCTFRLMGGRGLAQARQAAEAAARFYALVAAQGGTTLGEYLNSRTPVLCRCRNGHLVRPAPRSVLKGHRICRRCAGKEAASTTRQLAAAEAGFRARVTEQGGTVTGKYVNSKTPVACVCKNGHQCQPVPNKVQNGRRICPQCTIMDRPRTARSAAAEAVFRHHLTGRGATLLEPGWLGVMAPHHVLCENGHHCWPRPHDVARGTGICRACAGQDPAIAEARFRARVAEQGGTVTGPYKGANTPVSCVCKKGHPCAPRPASIQQGNGICRICGGQDAPGFARLRAIGEAAFRARVAELGEP